MIAPVLEDAGTRDADSRLPDGTLIANRYRVRKALGRGGACWVYEVQDEHLGLTLALKLLHPPSPTRRGASAALFDREYHTLSELAHPRIIHVFDYGVEAGRGFYTMELLDGQDLQSLGVLPWQRACALLCDVASSLAIIHSRRLVHRDVSARNVRCTGDGRAKLLDFGAMMPMGVPRDRIGTPPYLPPEALEMQGLDGRADLYSLGALAYLMLTGYHAYEARSFSALHAIWRSPPLLPSQYSAGIPPALDQLVMELLQLERAARPSTAAEVMERLSGIAGRPLIELPEVKRSYLVTPSLVGRQAELSIARTALSEMLAGHGGALLIEGEPGIGRSRCLDACVLESRLQSALVLRGDASDSAEGGEYGVLRALCGQLYQADRELCQRAALRTPSLSMLLPALGKPQEAAACAQPEAVRERTQRPPGATSPRHAILGAAQELLLEAARSRPLVLAVDDCHAIDEPSAALLGMLARASTESRVLLITTRVLAGANLPALTVLRDASTSILLQPLSAEQSEALLHSLFGEVAHVASLAAAIFEVAGGNPKATLTLIEQLIERDVARYEAGSWSLPPALDACDLPSSISDALLQRLSRASGHARDLVDILSLVDPTTLALDQYPALCAWDEARPSAYRTLEELLAAGILVRTGERYRFAQPGFADRVEGRLPEARKRALHERIAGALQTDVADARVARHLLLGGHERSAIAQLCDAYAHVAVVEARDLELLLTASSAAKRLGIGLGTRLELHSFLLQAAASAGRRDLFLTEDADELRHHCQLDSGLSDYGELTCDCSGERRTEEAIARARERYHTAPEAERGIAPERVAAAVARVYYAHNEMAAVSQDLELVERLPRLDMLAIAMPSLAAVQLLIDAQRSLQQGRTTAAVEMAQGLLRHVETHHDTLDPGMRDQTRLLAMLLLAMFAATGGQDSVPKLIAELSETPGHRSNAWRVRMVFALMRGNLSLAAECQRHGELLHLQDSGRAQFPGTTTRIELIAHVYAENVLGVKHVMERITSLSARYPGWRPTLAIARCQYRRLQGDAAGALLELEPVLQTRVGRHLDWWLIAYSHIKVLCDLARWQDAVNTGQEYLRVFMEERLSGIDYGLRQVTAEALTHAGRFAEARAMIESYIELHRQLGTRGLRLGLAYETAARLSMAQSDEAAISRYTTLCVAEYRGGRDLLLKAKLERLLREAEDFGVTVPPPVDTLTTGTSS